MKRLINTSVDIEDHVCVEEHREEDRTRLHGDELKVVSAPVAVMHVDGRDHPRRRQRQGSPALFGHQRSKLLRMMDVVSICGRREGTQKGGQSDHNQSFQSRQHILADLCDLGGNGYVEGLEEQRGIRMVVDEKKETWGMRRSREAATCMDATSRVQAWSGDSSSQQVDDSVVELLIGPIRRAHFPPVLDEVSPWAI